MTTNDNPKPILREERHGEIGQYIQEWRCMPPPIGKRFRVIRDEWFIDQDNGLPLRIIYEVKIL